MTTVELPASMKADVLDVRLFAPGQLVDLIKSVNTEHEGPAGTVWFLRHGSNPDTPGLTAGVRGDVGALDWFGETATEVPVDGRNSDDVDYFTPSGHHNAMPPGSELPVERVLEAVAEFVRTGVRPASIDWRPEDD